MTRSRTSRAAPLKRERESGDYHSRDTRIPEVHSSLGALACDPPRGGCRLGL